MYTSIFSRVDCSRAFCMKRPEIHVRRYLKRMSPLRHNAAPNALHTRSEKRAFVIITEKRETLCFDFPLNVDVSLSSQGNAPPSSNALNSEKFFARSATGR